MSMCMDKSLRPMQTLTMNCTECGEPLSKPAEMAGERDIDNNIALNADPEYVEKNVPSDNAICGKCGRPYKKDNLTSDMKGHKTCDPI